MKVRFLEVIDRMVGQIIRRLWEAERQHQAGSAGISISSAGGGGPLRRSFTIIVTGDHTTPVLFGDHSNGAHRM